jgi:PKD repeat protein
MLWEDFWLRPVWFLALGLGLFAGDATAQETVREHPLSVTYGTRASAIEGDEDHREVFFLSVPDNVTDPLYLRIFDPDASGDHDLISGKADTETRFRLFAGPGSARGTGSGTTEGRVLADRSFTADPAGDDRWITLKAIDPEDGDRVAGRRVFLLVVDGLSGDDANLYAVTLSLRDRRNLEPEGLEILAEQPTVRVPDKRTVTELQFTVPADADRLTIRNFDAANAQISLATGFRTRPLAASGQGDWRDTTVTVEPEERDVTAAILFSGGDEVPNDATFAVIDAAGRPVPIALPVRARRPNQRPVAAATIETLADCQAVAFDAAPTVDPDGDPLRYAWNFGDGTSGTGRTLIHRYPEPGSYAGELRVNDDSGAIDSGTVWPFTVFLKRPPTAVAGEDRVAAPGEALTFDGSASRAGDRPIARLRWNFQDGTKAEGTRVNHAFAASGRYTVTLTAEDDTAPPCNAGLGRLTVRVNSPPVAEAGADIRVAVGETVRFDGSRSYDIDGGIADHRWDFGDGVGIAGAVAQHAFGRPGTYVATLTVQDDAGVTNSISRDTLRVVVNDPPLAEAGSDRHVAPGEPITFDASASTDRDGFLVEQSWEFGDGAQGEGPRVVYAYAKPGIYRVKLTVIDDSGTSTRQAEDGLTVIVNAPPVAEAGPDQLVTSSVIRFDGSGSSDPDGRIARYDWDFGDGGTGSGPTPTHVYRASGDYRVRLTVTDDSGTIRSNAGDTLRVRVNAAPIADAGPDQIVAPGQTVGFSGRGSLDPDGDIVAYQWDFGDGTSASGPAVSYSFADPGTYRVRLTVGDDTRQTAAVDFDEAMVFVNTPPVADAGPDQIAAPGQTVQLSGCGSFDAEGAITSYRWDFSDLDTPAKGCRTTRTYPNPGTYTARLTAADRSGAPNGTTQDELIVRINHPPVAAAGPDIVSGSTIIDFDASASADADGDPLTYEWDFGDGSPSAGGVRVTHSYAEGGIYPVTLTVNDGTGLANGSARQALTVTINRLPVAVAGANRKVCAGDVVLFDGSRSSDPDGGLLRYRWDFGDGTGADTVNPTKTFRTGAVYPVTLTVEDESGYPASRHTDRAVVTVDESPIAEAGPDRAVCANTEVHFDGSASRDFDGVVNRFTWDFGDGAVGGGERPVHIFRRPGDYRVLLTIEGDNVGQCPNTGTDEAAVHVVAAPVARIEAPDRIPIGSPAVFRAGTEGGIVGWHWDFGDGATAEGREVDHVFAQPGVYRVSLSVQPGADASACNVVTAKHRIVANAPPVADAGPDRAVATQEEVTFDGSASADSDGAVSLYRWDFGDGATATGMVVRHRFRDSGSYPVTLTVTDDADLPNSQASDRATVTVNGTPVPAIVAAPACPGTPASLSAAGTTDPDGAIRRFEWDFGDGDRATGAEVSHVYPEPGIYDVVLIADDEAGLGNSRRSTAHALHVNRPPSAAAGPDRTVCPSDVVGFDASGSVDWDGKLVRYRWAFGDGTTADGAAVNHRFRDPGHYEVRLSVTDDSGSACAVAEDVAEVHVNAPPVVEAGADRKAFAGGAHDDVLFDASRSFDPDGAGLDYAWQFGDGIVRSGARLRHAFTAPGAYKVRVAVRDGSGLVCGETVSEMAVEVSSHD